MVIVSRLINGSRSADPLVTASDLPVGDGDPKARVNDAAAPGGPAVTLLEYVFALCILLGSLMLPAAGFYAVLRFTSARQADAPRIQGP